MSELSASQTPVRGASKPLPPSALMFDHEKLDAYQVELRFIAWVTNLLEDVAKQPRLKTAEVCDQLDRASLSALLNTAEGNGKRQRQGRAKFFDDARGSATECAACLDVLVAKRAATEERVLEGKQMLVRIVSMLCGLVDRFDVAGQLREESTLPEVLPFMQVGNVNYGRNQSRARTRTRRK